MDKQQEYAKRRPTVEQDPEAAMQQITKQCSGCKFSWKHLKKPETPYAGWCYMFYDPVLHCAQFQPAKPKGASYGSRRTDHRRD